MEAQRLAYAKKKWNARKALLKDLGTQLDRDLNQYEGEVKNWMTYLLATLPTQDLAEYPLASFEEGIRHSLMLRETIGWCRDLPEDLFTDYVFYPRVNTEDLSEARPLFYQALMLRVEPYVKAGEIEKAVLETNFWCQEHVTYQMADDRTKSALTTYLSGAGRCGEESTFAVMALRSLGIPARQVYAPWWSHCDDNHAWVEFYVRGKWHFTGACEPAPRYDTGWFTNASSRAMVEHARTFTGASTKEDLTVLYGERADRFYVEDGVTYELITDHYAKVVPVTVNVFTSAGEPAKNCLVRFEILNMAEMVSAANIHTDSRGQVELVLGLGNVLLHAIDEATGAFAEKLIMVEEEADQVFTVVLGSQDITEEEAEGYQAFDFYSPLDTPINPGILSTEEKRERHERMEHGNGLRNARNESWYQEEQAKEYPKEVQERLHIARGNFDELILFLKRGALGDQKLREALILQLTLKDMTDVKASVLEEHLICSAEYSRDYPMDIYVPYILSPRVFNERLTEYRVFIENFFDPKTKKLFRRDPRKIMDYIHGHLLVDKSQDYPDLFYTPTAALKSGHVNAQSKKILFVAICRTLGIPARLNPVSSDAEYLDGKRFKKAEESKKTATQALTLVSEDIKPWIDRQTFTVCRLEHGFYSRLDMPLPKTEGSKGMYQVEVEKGDYRLITVNRLPNGHMYAYQKCFRVEDQPVNIELRMRPVDLLETVSHNPIFEFEVQKERGTYGKISSLLEARTNLLLWLEVGKEPTEHILNEMLQQKEDFQNAKADIFFILKEPADKTQVTLAKALSVFPRVRILYDDFTDNVSGLARRMYVDPDKLPLVLLLNDGLTGIYASSGYNVGLGDILIRLIRALEE